jgi:hypothetical protein
VTPPTYDASPGDDASPPEDAGVDTSTGDDASPTDGSVSTDAAGDADAAPASVPCNADSDCSANGARCVNGLCTAQVNLCSDTTQCRVPGEACVDGLCEPRCSASTPCPTGWSCDPTRHVCNDNSSPNACPSTACSNGTVCVEGHCAYPCAAPDAGPACPAGQLCVNGGCVADQAAVFSCTNDGQSGAASNGCTGSNLCIHHDCYSSCSQPSDCGDGGSICKQVTIETGKYGVCGTATTLGSDCDPAQGKACTAGRVCVDGYCL